MGGPRWPERRTHGDQDGSDQGCLVEAAPGQHGEHETGRTRGTWHHGPPVLFLELDTSSPTFGAPLQTPRNRRNPFEPPLAPRPKELMFVRTCRHSVKWLTALCDGERQHVRHFAVCSHLVDSRSHVVVSVSLLPCGCSGQHGSRKWLGVSGHGWQSASPRSVVSRGIGSGNSFSLRQARKPERWLREPDARLVQEAVRLG